MNVTKQKLPHPSEVYEHLYLVKESQEDGWKPTYDYEADDEFKLMRDVCIGRGLTSYVPRQWAEGFYYQVTAEGELALRDWKQQGGEPAKVKRGRPKTSGEDKKIADEYEAGRKTGEWKSQVEYLKKMYPTRYKENPTATKSWFSTLLRRVGETEID